MLIKFKEISGILYGIPHKHIFNNLNVNFAIEKNEEGYYDIYVSPDVGGDMYLLFIDMPDSYDKASEGDAKSRCDSWFDLLMSQKINSPEKFGYLEIEDLGEKKSSEVVENFFNAMADSQKSGPPRKKVFDKKTGEIMCLLSENRHKKAPNDTADH